MEFIAGIACLPPAYALYGVLLQQQAEVYIPASLPGLGYYDLHDMAIDKDVLLAGIRPSVGCQRSSVERLLPGVEFSDAKDGNGSAP